MDERDAALRNRTYALFVELGRAPSVAELAAATGLAEAEVAAAWRRLHDAHALVLEPDRLAIRMANPFSAVPTAHRVEAAGRRWYANCAWDAVGVCAALHVDGSVETVCPDCGDALRLDIRGGRPSDETLVFQCLVPAERWWADIGFT